MSQPPISTGAPTPPVTDAAAALAALAWLVEAGVDTLVDATPVRWLDAAAAAAAEPAVIVPSLPAASTARADAAHSAQANATAHSARAARAVSLDTLAALLADVAGRPVLFADGNAASRVMVLGDMPSPDDMAAGRLFSGPGGALLDAMLAAIGRDRADTYLANLLTLPTPGGRAPQPHEIDAALPYARRHIELVRPHALLVLGGVAAAALLGVESGINRLRGRWQTFETGALTVPLLPSFAPAYLLAHPAHKALAWRDLLLFKSAVATHTGAP